MLVNAIKGFTNEYFWLSNFSVSPIETDFGMFPTVEHAYQWCKTLFSVPCPAIADSIQEAATPNQAKKFGRMVPLDVEAWDLAKDDCMRWALRYKFDQDAGLSGALIDTSPAYLEETNWWGDTYWGVCKGVGKNTLGILLMELRGFYINEESLYPVIQAART